MPVNLEKTPDVTYVPNGVITEWDTVMSYSPKRFTGRRIITTPYAEITESNVVEVLSKTQAVHSRNAAEIDYLYRVYCGCQDVQYKQKEARPNINNKVCVNRANEVVTFKSAYLLREPIQYVSRGSEKSVSDMVNTLNEYMRAEDKESKDKEIVDWIHIGGVGIRLALPDPDDERDGAPFYIATIDPRTAYVIYQSGIRRTPLAGVLNLRDEQDEPFSYVYTRNACYTVKNGELTDVTPNLDFGEPPIVEYAANMPRMGAFETVLSILNAINTLESNALDSVQDFVNAFDVFKNCELEDGEYSDLSTGGKAISIKTTTVGMEADVYRITSELSQSGVQTRIDDLTDAYLTICGMPNRNGGTSTSDTGTAVIFRDGWSEAESRAKDTEKSFIRSERRLLRVILRICNAKAGANLDDLQLKDIGIDFARKSLSNVQSKVQALCELLNNDSIHPKLAFDSFGDIFGDKETAYRISMEWKEQQDAKAEEQLQAELEAARTSANGGNSNSGSNSDSDTGGSGESNAGKVINDDA